MPKEVKYSAPVSAFGRLAVNSHTSIDNSGRAMPVNTRSMQRFSSTPQGPPGQVLPGASRGTPQYGISRTATTTIGASNDNEESSDEDTDDDGEDEGDVGNDNNDSSDAEEGDSDDDEDDPESEVREMFAIAEPSGLVPEEEVNRGMNQASSSFYRRLLDVVAAEAARNERFLDELKTAVPVPGRAWGLLMYSRLRTRLEAIMSKFDQNPRTHDAINTATHLKWLIVAINSMIQPGHWQVMDPITRQQYFGLLLDLLRGVVDRNPRDHSDRTRHGQGSRSGAPYVTETDRDVDLYEQMKDTQENKEGVLLLGRLFRLLHPQGLDARQKEHISSLLRAVQQRLRLSDAAVASDPSHPTQVFGALLRNMHAEITRGMSGSSHGSRSSRSS